MKKKVQRMIAGAMAVTMAAALVSGCSISSTETTGTAGTGTETSQTPQIEEPVQLSWLMGRNSAEVDDDSPVVKKIEERFNIDLKGFYVDATNFQENLNVKFAGGEMPDIMVIDTPAMLATYVEGGIVGELPIEVIREKAPNFTKIADQYDDGSLWGTMIYEGKNYGVSNPMQVVPMAMFWRKDWLDKLNLEVPETLEEYEKVLTAFVENDPDGNGKKDTAGMAERSFNAVFGAFGLRCTSGLSTTSGFVVEEMQLGEDNVPFFPYIRPEAKEALTVLHDWYTKGIIDKEFITGENHGGSFPFLHERADWLDLRSDVSLFWPQPGYERCQKQGNLPERTAGGESGGGGGNRSGSCRTGWKIRYGGLGKGGNPDLPDDQRGQRSKKSRCISGYAGRVLLGPGVYGAGKLRN